jgi:hypothetical protein
MKQITVMFREEPDMIKLLDLIDMIGHDANDLGLVVDATFEDVDDPIVKLSDDLEAFIEDNIDDWEDDFPDIDLT